MWVYTYQYTCVSFANMVCNIYDKALENIYAYKLPRYIKFIQLKTGKLVSINACTTLLNR